MLKALTVLCLACVLVESAPRGAPGGIAADLKHEFEALDDKGDQAGVVALWRAHPYDALGVIDSYLEGSLALREHPKGSDADLATSIRAMHQRALRGARAADEAFGRVLFSDYAASFVGWTQAQQKLFREGQEAHRAGRKASKAKQFDEALKQAQRCLDLARPLGDWWGTAMGLSAVGECERQLGHPEAALDALAQARHLHHELGLVGDEYANLRSIAQLASDLGRGPRALRAIEAALELAPIVEDAQGPLALLELRAKLQDTAGDSAAAQATRAELEKRRGAGGDKH
jgi:tetratricopeptide (TPR) repeat protein